MSSIFTVSVNSALVNVGEKANGTKSGNQGWRVFGAVATSIPEGVSLANWAEKAPPITLVVNGVRVETKARISKNSGKAGWESRPGTQVTLPDGRKVVVQIYMTVVKSEVGIVHGVNNVAVTGNLTVCKAKSSQVEPPVSTNAMANALDAAPAPKTAPVASAALTAATPAATPTQQFIDIPGMGKFWVTTQNGQPALVPVVMPAAPAPVAAPSGQDQF